MWFIKLLQKRPSDLTIRVWRIIFGLILIWSLYYSLIYSSTPDTIDNNFFWVDLDKKTVEYIKYIFVWIWIVPIIMWAFNICLFKKKYVRIIQIIFGIILFYIAHKIKISDPDTLWVDTLIWFMGLLPLLAWITWKCITTKCMKYKEKITKIRV